MRFQSIPGLEEEKSTLIHSVKTNHVAHALLFHGKPGSGNLALALAFGTFLNCESPLENDSCGSCASCVKMDKMVHPDVNFIFPTAGGKKVLSETFLTEWRSFAIENPYAEISDWLEKINIKQGNIPVEEARQLIQNLSLKSYEGGYKLVYIWLPEYLNSATANAILKILEEPPAQTIFMLVCHQSQQLLTTIISRTQRFPVSKFTAKAIEGVLSLKGVTANRAKEIAYLSDGNMNKAIQLAAAKGGEFQEWFAAWMRAIYGFNVEELVNKADEFDSQSKEQQKQLLEYGLEIFREIFLTASGNEAMVKLETKALEFVQKFSKVFPIHQLPKFTEMFDEAIFHLERNVRAKIMFLDLSLQMAKIIK